MQNDLETRKKLIGPGFRRFGDGAFVPKEDAFSYAIEQCVNIIPAGFHNIEWTKEFKDMLVEWFYSDNWIEVEEA